VKGVRLRPTTKRAFAANSTEIDLAGETELNLKIGDLELPTKAIVSDNIEEGLIGFDWLERHDVFWGFGIGRVSIDGKIFTLSPKAEGGSRCCQVVVQEDIVVPSFSEAIVPGKIVYGAEQIARFNSASTEKLELVVEPREVRDGLCVAGTVIPQRCHNVPVRVVNTSCRNINLEVDESLGELQEMQLCNVIPCPAVDRDSAVTGDWLEKLVEGVDSSVNSTEKRGFVEC